ncbi:MAG: methyltransferase domain-containing protein [Flavobacterium sp.]|nr:MAG: methyltransferase domain-containing protein [Flavobacterium sp.]
MSTSFQFKQFVVEQDRCAMKIGTDGVLLGAWTSLDNRPQSILDIGSGTGVIALQMAQRSLAETIDAIELDPDAYEQCSENFEASPWNDRLFCYHASVQEFTAEMDLTYNLIVSNPPFYTDEYKTDDPARDRARFTDTLPFDHLFLCAIQLLALDGIFSVIVPKKEQENVMRIAAHHGLHPRRICEVRGTVNSKVKRILVEFSREKFRSPVTEQLTIENERHNYTDSYVNLVKDFYLKM